MASDGVSETRLDFELLPHFYQTLWIRFVLLILLAAGILVIIRLRVLRVEREFRAVSAERNRIAREIHDTALAQGYVGISLQLEVLGQLLQHNRTEAATNLLKSGPGACPGRTGGCTAIDLGSTIPRLTRTKLAHKFAAAGREIRRRTSFVFAEHSRCLSRTAARNGTGDSTHRAGGYSRTPSAMPKRASCKSGWITSSE